MDTALPHGVVPAPGLRYVHDALFYSSPDELAAAIVPFVRDGLAAGDAVVVAASPATADVVRPAHGDDLSRGRDGRVAGPPAVRPRRRQLRPGRRHGPADDRAALTPAARLAA